jgi:DNA-binding transcriptional ArsR family regulator
MSEGPKLLLSTLMVLGAQSPEKALPIDELATKLGMGVPELQAELDRLTKAGYVVTTRQEGRSRVYLTGTGVITASSAYS